MKTIIVKMVPGVEQILLSINGLCQSEDGSPRPDGSGYSLHRWIDSEWAEYYLGADDAVFDAAVNEMVAQGLTITFPPPVLTQKVDEKGELVFYPDGTTPIMVDEDGNIVVVEEDEI